MSRYIIESNLSYPKAVLLIKELSTVGVEADVTCGAIAAYPESDEQVEEMNKIVKKYGGVASQGGESTHFQMVVDDLIKEKNLEKDLIKKIKDIDPSIPYEVFLCPGFGWGEPKLI